MELIGLGLLAVLLVIQPFGIRNLLNSLELQADRTFDYRIPWMVCRVKSFFVGRLLATSILILLMQIGLYWVVARNFGAGQAFYWMALLSCIQFPFALWNFVNGSLVRVELTDLQRNQIEAEVRAWPELNRPGVTADEIEREVRDAIQERAWQPRSRFYIRSTFSHPLYWAAFVVVTWMAQGVALVYEAVMRDAPVASMLCDSRIEIALGLLAFLVGWVGLKIAAEIAAWTVLKGTFLGEKIATAAVTLDFIPENIRKLVPKDGVNVLEEEKIAAALRKYTNLLVIAWGPFLAAIFWWPDPLVAGAFLAATLFAAFFSLAYASLGGGEEVDESTKRTIGFLWRYGKYVTLLVCGLGVLFQLSEGARMTWDDYGNIMAGISPVWHVTHRWWHYFLAFLALGIVQVVALSHLKPKSKWHLFWRVPFYAMLAYFFFAPIIIASGTRTFSLSPRYPDKADPPVGVQTPVAEFRGLVNGRKELVITVTTDKPGKGVVEFGDKLTSYRFGAASGLSLVDVNELRGWQGRGQLPLRYVGLTTGDKLRESECSKHPACKYVYEIRVPDLTGSETGSYRVLMRNRPYGQAEVTPLFDIQSKAVASKQ